MTESSAGELFTKHDDAAPPGFFDAEAAGLAWLAAAGPGVGGRAWRCTPCTPTGSCCSGCTPSG